MRLKWLYGWLVARPERVFLVLGSVFGILFLFLIPPFQSFDEHSHYLRVYQLTEGDISSQMIKPYGAGGDIQTDVVASTYALLGDKTKGEAQWPYDINIIQKYWNVSPDQKHGDTQAQFPNTAVYSPLVYLPHIAGLFIAKDIFNANIIAMIYLTRLAGLIFWVYCVYSIIKLLPFGKWALVTIALLPTSVYGAVTVNADMMTAVTAFLLIAYTLFLYNQQRTITLTEGLILTGILTALGLMKPGYILIGLIGLVLYKRLPGSAIKRVATVGGMLLLACIPMLLWVYSVQDIAPEIAKVFKPGGHVSAYEQLVAIFLHPMTLLKAFLLYFMTPHGAMTFTGFFGLVGWGEYMPPAWMLGLGTLLLTIALVYTTREEYQLIKTLKIPRIKVGLLFIMCLLAIPGLLYLTWTDVGSSQLQGVQGRYFLPFIPLLILVLQSNFVRFKGDGITRGWILTGGTIIMLSSFVMLLLIHFWM